MYHTLHEAVCSRCGNTYSSTTHPKIDRWGQMTLEDLGGNDYPYSPDVFELCKGCAELAREFIENTSTIPVSVKGESPMAAWERELLADPEANVGTAILDRLADILYPMDEYRDSQWNGGDVCEAVAELLRGYRPDAQYRQPVEPALFSEGERVLLDLPVEGHKHEWRWGNQMFADKITRRYCVECGVLFTDL